MKASDGTALVIWALYWPAMAGCVPLVHDGDAADSGRSKIDANEEPLSDGGGQPDGGRDAGRDAGREVSDASVEGPCSAEPRISNVLVIIYSPILADGKDLQTKMAIRDGRAISAELAARVREASHGIIHYNIVKADVIPAWPPQLPDARVMDEPTFFSGAPDPTNNRHGNADYAAIFENLQICQTVVDLNISELWLWGAGYAAADFGFDSFSYRLSAELAASMPAEELDLYERRRHDMPSCAGRTLWVRGGQYTVDHTWAMKTHTARIHETLRWALPALATDPAAAQERWGEFSSYALDGSPGLANVGTPDAPPNAGLDRTPAPTLPDYDNQALVLSGASRWLAYPELEGPLETINCMAWGCTKDGFQQWYAEHVPHGEGQSADGTCNNWWTYVADPEGTLTRCSGSACKVPTGQPCASNADCASGYCVCKDGEPPQWAACSETPGEACPSPAWWPCLQDADCQSRHCGCNGVDHKVCLPDEAYVSTCP